MPIVRIYDGVVRDLPLHSAGQSPHKFYDKLVAYFSLGMFGEAALYANETVPEVTKHLIHACDRAGIGIEIISTHRRTVFFKIVAPTQGTLEI